MQIKQFVVFAQQISSCCCLFKVEYITWCQKWDSSPRPHSWTSLGPVVQSIVSLTSSLRVISLTVLTDSIYNILNFFAEKM